MNNFVSHLVFILAAGIGWGIAAAGYVFKMSTDCGKLAAGIGAVTAVFLASLFARKNFSWRSGLKWAALFAVLSYLLPAGISRWSPVGLPLTLITIESVDLFLKALASVLLIRVLSQQFAWAGAVEVALAVWALSAATSPHRRSIARPFWLVDFFVEHGRQAPSAFWIVGILAAIVGTLLLFSHLQRSSSVFDALTLFVLAAGFLGLAVGLSSLFPPLGLAPPSPPPPKEQFPQTPPPPQPVALVKLLQSYRPTERLGGYYFRTHRYEVFDDHDLHETAPITPGTEAAIPFPDAQWTYTGSEFGDNLNNELATVRAQVYHLEQPERPLCLVSTIGYTPRVPHDPRFTVTYEITAIPPGKITEDLRLGALRQKFGNPAWAPEELEQYTRAPENPQFAGLAQEILHSLKSLYAEYPGPRLAAVRNWINQNLTFSSRMESQGEVKSVQQVLFETQIGGAKHFALAATYLFRLAGIPARMAAGYRYPVLREESKDGLLLYDVDHTYWPEVYLTGSGWVPVPLNPQNVLDRPKSPPRHDEEVIITEVAESSEQKIEPDSLQPTLVQELVALIVLIGLLAVISLNFWRRWLSLRLCFSEPRFARRVFRAALDLLAIAGFRRQYGQTRLEFARAISAQAPALGQHVMHLTEMYSRAVRQEASLRLPHAGWHRELHALGREATRIWFKNFKSAILSDTTRKKEVHESNNFGYALNPLCWWNADHPQPGRSIRQGQPFIPYNGTTGVVDVPRTALSGYTRTNENQGN